MHELSVALALVEAASEAIDSRRIRRVIAVHVRIGAVAGIDRDALQFSFDVAAAGSVLEGTQLRIQTIPVMVWCAACEDERPVASVYSRRCATCAAIAPRIVRGDELELVGLEISDDDDEVDRGSPEPVEQK